LLSIKGRSVKLLTHCSTSPSDIVALFKSAPAAPVYLEDPYSAVHPPAHLRPLFNFGRSVGMVEGACYGVKGELPHLVEPKSWKAYWHLTGKDKKASVAVVRQLMPDADLRSTPRAKTESVDLCDSILIALAGKGYNG
jgi:hypothetical protein